MPIRYTVAAGATHFIGEEMSSGAKWHPEMQSQHTAELEWGPKVYSWL